MKGSLCKVVTDYKNDDNTIGMRVGKGYNENDSKDIWFVTHVSSQLDHHLPELGGWGWQ